MEVTKHGNVALATQWLLLLNVIYTLWLFPAGCHQGSHNLPLIKSKCWSCYWTVIMRWTLKKWLFSQFRFSSAQIQNCICKRAKYAVWMIKETSTVYFLVMGQISLSVVVYSSTIIGAALLYSKYVWAPWDFFLHGRERWCQSPVSRWQKTRKWSHRAPVTHTCKQTGVSRVSDKALVPVTPGRSRHASPWLGMTSGSAAPVTGPWKFSPRFTPADFLFFPFWLLFPSFLVVILLQFISSLAITKDVGGTADKVPIPQTKTYESS